MAKTKGRQEVNQMPVPLLQTGFAGIRCSWGGWLRAGGLCGHCVGEVFVIMSAAWVQTGFAGMRCSWRDWLCVGEVFEIMSDIRGQIGFTGIRCSWGSWLCVEKVFVIMFGTCLQTGSAGKRRTLARPGNKKSSFGCTTI